MKGNADYNWKDTEVLITGGTGSLGRTLTRLLLTEYKPKGIRIFSRDELKQWEFRNELAAEGYDQGISWLLGDVRDPARVDRALNRVNVVFNTAAMKQVPACEDNPFEAIQTNITGARNIIDGAIDNNVSLVMHVSTDKMCYPVNLYGATKLVAEKVFIHGNVYAGNQKTRFSACRYGNVVGSRGSLVPLFLEQIRKHGYVTLTHPEMTRFWVSLERMARFIINSSTVTTGGEIFVPLMRTVRITDIIAAMESDALVTGIRPGEKLHECLITEEESENTIALPSSFCIGREKVLRGDRWTYSSNTGNMLSIDEIKQYIEEWKDVYNGQSGA